MSCNTDACASACERTCVTLHQSVAHLKLRNDALGRLVVEHFAQRAAVGERHYQVRAPRVAHLAPAVLKDAEQWRNIGVPQLAPRVERLGRRCIAQAHNGHADAAALRAKSRAQALQNLFACV